MMNARISPSDVDQVIDVLMSLHPDIPVFDRRTRDLRRSVANRARPAGDADNDPPSVSALVPFKNLVHMDVHETHFYTEESLACLGGMIRLRVLDASRAAYDEGVPFPHWGPTGPRFLSGLLYLEELDIGRNFGDHANDVVDAVSTLTRLKKLDISCSGLKDEHIARLTGLTNLEKLVIGRNELTDGSMRTVSTSFPRLESLSFPVNMITNEGIGYLSTMTGLKELDMSWNDVSSGCFTHLSNLVNLETLVSVGVFDDRTLGVDDIRAIAGLSSLRTLNVEYCMFDDLDAFLEMMHLTGLTSLDMRETCVAGDGDDTFDVGCGFLCQILPSMKNLVNVFVFNNITPVEAYNSFFSEFLPDLTYHVSASPDDEYVDWEF